MKISQAIRKAWQAYTAHPGDTLKFLITELCLTLICCAPLLFLFDQKLMWLSLISVPLFLVILIPARMNAALAMRDALAGGRLFSRQLVDLSGFGAKLACGLKRCFFLLLWAAPLLVSLYLIWTHISGEMDGFTLMRMIRKDFGGGDLFRGAALIAGAVLLTVLLLVFGFAFHSGARHAFAQGSPARVRGHHGKIVLTWLAALLAVLFFLAALVIAVSRYVPVLSDLNGLFMGSVNLPSTRVTLIILGAGALLSLPLLPLRSLISAAFVSGLKEKEARRCCGWTDGWPPWIWAAGARSGI